MTPLSRCASIVVFLGIWILQATALAAPASAQLGGMCPDNICPPSITVSPGSGSVGSPLSVSISWVAEDYALSSGTRSITFNGSNVTSSFSYSGNTASATSSGTLTLNNGTNSFHAHICDTQSNCSDEYVTWTYDAVDPTVSISPAGGYRNSSSLSVTVSWADNVSLNAASREITRNSTAVTSSFGYSGTSTSAQSSGTITLSSGPNLVRGEICDQAGNCGVGSVSYTLDTGAPSISLSPSSSTQNGSSRSVTINWGDLYALNSGTRWVKLNGTTVTSSFSYSGSATSATSSGTVSLAVGANTLQAHICDQAGNCATQSASYYRDTTLPSVSISPSAGTFNSASRSVTVSWGDNYSLNSGTRWIKLNGTTVTSSFNWSGSATSASSSGTVTLATGSNTLEARICDTAGNCRTQTASYYLDTTLPSVSISPGTGGVYSSASRSATITWGDNHSLNASSRWVKLNGSTVTGSFTWSGSATSATSSGTVSLASGNNTLEGRICDSGGNCRTSTVSYYYDSANPTISFTPNSGTYSSASRQVTVSWGDNHSLSSGTRWIKLNGTLVTASFGYTGTATSASSTGTVTLAPGGNTLQAHICDTSGRCSTQSSGTLTYDNSSPTIAVSPSDGAFSGSQRSVSITWSDNLGLNAGSRWVKLDGTDITANFSYSGTSTSATSADDITLGAGYNDLEARICDTSGRCSTVMRSYFYDTVNPTVSLDPAAGTYGSAARSVTIDWGDDHALDGSSYAVTLNGAPVTGSFGYSGSSTAASSSGSVTLQPGANTIIASIEDAAGRVKADTATYVYDTPPVIAFTPNGGAHGIEAAVEIDWTDDNGLDYGSRSITLNGEHWTPRFAHYDTATKAGVSNALLELAAGANTLAATICDGFGGCTTETATFTSDRAGPTVTISPARANIVAASSGSIASQAVTITWSDAVGLDLATRLIRLDGQDVTSTFTHSGSGTSATSSKTLSLDVAGHRLEATICDAGGLCSTEEAYFNHGFAAAPVIQPADADAGATLARDLCVRADLGAGEAECGDLRLGHAMPTVRTMNTARTPVLTWVSEHASPRGVVAVNVKLPQGSIAPDSVVAVLVIQGTSPDTLRRSWDGDEWLAGEASRIAFDGVAAGRATGIHPYQLEVTNWYGGTQHPGTVFNGAFVAVDRSSSPYGAGWWIAGLERLYFSGSDLVWVGGDGSARLYAAAGTGVWKAPQLTRRDSITVSGTVYTRHLPGGLRVLFDAQGRHTETVNRLGHRTLFRYGTSPERVVRILVPLPGTDSVPYFGLAYDASDRLSSVTAYGEGVQRTTQVAYHGTSRRIASITDPDGDATTFAYGDAGVPNRITSRADRRGVSTTFAFGAAGKVAGATLDPDSVAAVIAITPAEGLGVSPTAIRDALVATRIDGPRTDVQDTTTFRLDRFGAPLAVTDALGATTTLERNSAAYPAAITKVTAPNGFVTTRTIDTLGRVNRVIAHDPRGDNASRRDTTRVVYHGTWKDFPRYVISPLHDTTTFTYDGTTGNRLSEEDALGNVVTYRYTTATHQLRAVDPPETPADSAAYDANGNLAYSVTPLGAWTRFATDGLGQVDSVETAVTDTTSTVTTITRDLLGREIASETTTPAMSYSNPMGGEVVAAQTFSINTDYDDNGNVLAVQRVASISSETETSYDRLNRVILHRGDQVRGKDRSVYDPAGNVVETITARGDTIRMKYDALNRLVRRIVPAVDYSAETCPPGQTCAFTFPLYPNNANGGLTVFGDTVTFTYDVAGRMTSAWNRSARIARSYYPDGLLRTDSLRIRRYEPHGGPEICPDNDPELCPEPEIDIVAADERDPYPAGEFLNHVYGLTYEYDAVGRRTALVMPSEVVSSLTSDRTRYFYQRNGALDSIADPYGNDFAFDYDGKGRLIEYRYPGGGEEIRTYDHDDRLIRRTEATDSLWLRKDTLTYDLRGKVLTVQALAGATGWTVTNAYSGAGHLVSYVWEAPTFETKRQEYRYDGLGHTTWKRTWNSTQTTEWVEYLYDYAAAADRLTGFRADTVSQALQSSPWGDSTATTYDASGNAVFEMRQGAGFGPSGEVIQNRDRQSRSYYSADNVLRFHQKEDWHFALNEAGGGTNVERGAFDDFQYDALGRRVMARTRQDSSCTVECVSAIQRFVWDGNTLLYETRADGSYGAALDSDGSGDSDAQYGQVLYTQGPVIDRPLAIIRFDYKSQGTKVLIPHTDWRGTFDSGTKPSGAKATCATYPCSTGFAIAWPANRLAYSETGEGVLDWLGSQLSDMRDGSGLLYRRNRYYNPETGQFTQSDPIGLAGGMNLYGYANGDPVTFSDPFGLCPQWLTGRPCSGGVDFGAGLVPGLSTGVDAATAISGQNPLTGERVGVGGRLIALAGLITPGVSGGAIRGVGEAIGRGHAFAKHVLEGEFAGLGIRTTKQFGQFIDNIMETATGNNVRSLSRGRTAYWDDATGTVVIHDPRSTDLGTAFRPEGGRDYFDNLR